jgi:hypothetical protein
VLLFTLPLVAAFGPTANSLVRSLVELFRREIGLKSFTEVGESVFGSKVMKEPLTLWRHTLLL